MMPHQKPQKIILKYSPIFFFLVYEKNYYMLNKKTKILIFLKYNIITIKLKN